VPVALVVKSYAPPLAIARSYERTPRQAEPGRCGMLVDSVIEPIIIGITSSSTAHGARPDAACRAIAYSPFLILRRPRAIPALAAASRILEGFIPRRERKKRAVRKLGILEASLA
jgi:hypothetical protein